MSYKIFVAATMLGLTFAGCNANLSTGHPNNKAPAANNQQKTPAASTTTNTTPAAAAAKTAIGTTQAIDPNLAGTFACDSNAGSGFDACMPDETITISADFTMLTLEVTGAINGAPDCHTVDDATLATPTKIDQNGVVTVVATFNAWTLDTAGKKDTTCTTAFTKAKPAVVPSGTITLDASDPTGNFLIYTNGDVKIQLKRVDPSATNSSGTATAPATVTPLDSVAPAPATQPATQAAAPVSTGAQQPIAPASTGAQQPVAPAAATQPVAPATEAAAQTH